MLPRAWYSYSMRDLVYGVSRVHEPRTDDHDLLLLRLEWRFGLRGDAIKIMVQVLTLS